jgi:hypothetical protein
LQSTVAANHFEWEGLQWILHRVPIAVEDQQQQNHKFHRADTPVSNKLFYTYE